MEYKTFQAKLFKECNLSYLLIIIHNEYVYFDFRYCCHCFNYYCLRFVTYILHIEDAIYTHTH